MMSEEEDGKYLPFRLGTTRTTRIFGMITLFTLVTSLLVEHWKYAGPAIMVAVITGGFVGEAWHRWRTGTL